MHRTVQEDLNNFIADHFLYVLLRCRVRCPKGAKNGLLERFVSSACGHHGADPPPPLTMSDFHIFRRAIAPFSLYSAGNGRRNQ